MSWATILFPFGVRLSTWLAAAVFVVLGARARDRRFWLAGAAWLFGFEVAYQFASLATHPLPRYQWGPFLLILVGVAAVAAAARAGVWPSGFWLLAAGCCFAAWTLTGFHVNGSAAHIDPTGEALNEAAKTLLAVAYLAAVRSAARSARTRHTRRRRARAVAPQPLAWRD